jgi:elongation factor P
MLSHSDLRKGVRILIDGEPYEVLEASPMKKAQRQVTIQTKMKNLLTGSAMEKTFHQGDVFDEAELIKFSAKFLYGHRDNYFFCEEKNPSKRFELDAEKMGTAGKFLKSNQVVDAFIFNEKIIGISLPVKVTLKVTETPPGLKGDRAQAGNKVATLESGAQVNVPLFIDEGDTIEINTETSEYVRRAE